MIAKYLIILSECMILLYGQQDIESIRCYRRYGQYLFKPIEFWQELDKHERFIFRINEFWDFPNGFGHQQHEYLYNDICWRYKLFIKDFQLHAFVPQIDRDEWYDGCQVEF